VAQSFHFKGKSKVKRSKVKSVQDQKRSRTFETGYGRRELETFEMSVNGMLKEEALEEGAQTNK
jgi:hypothetical protein